jgi:type IVB pilus formation R64 PilN family outer membrane protein
MPISYSGPLSGLLEQVCGYFSINWRFDGSSISLSRYETRVFVIEALPGTTSIKDGVTDPSSSGGSGAASGGAASKNDLQQSASVTVDFKVWEELEKTVTALLNGTGNVVIAPSSGTLTVTTTPDIMRNVAKFIEDENKRLSRQIAINVEVYVVSLSNEEDFGVTLTTAFNKLSNLNTTTAAMPSFTNSTSLGTLGVTVLNTKQGKATSVLSALSSLGDTSRVAQFPLTTLNNRPVTRRIGHDKAYVESFSNSTGTSSTYTSSTVSTGTVQEGFSLQLTPRALDDGRIMLQYSFSLIDLLDLAKFNTSTGGDTTSSSSSGLPSYVQLPETTNRVFIQQSMLRSGSTLVIGGFDDQQAAQNAQGVGNPFNFLLGGGATSTTSRKMLFITITPQILDVPQAEQD